MISSISDFGLYVVEIRIREKYVVRAQKR